MGYGTDFEEWVDKFYDQLRDAYLYQLTCFERCEDSFYVLLLRDMILPLYCFDNTLFEIFLGAYVCMIVHFDETYITDIYVYELSVVQTVF